MSEGSLYEKLGKSIVIEKLKRENKEQINKFISDCEDIAEINIPLFQKFNEKMTEEDFSEYIKLNNSYYFLEDKELKEIIGIFYLDISSNEINFAIRKSKRNKGYGKAGIHILIHQLSKDYPEIKEYFFPIKRQNIYASLVIYGNNGTLIKETEDTMVLSIQKNNTLWIHRAFKQDLPKINVITNQAKKLLKASGSMQWQSGYPNEETFINDINNKALYGLYENEIIVGFGAYILGKDLNYVNIEGGKWDIPANDRDMAIHRVAVEENCHRKQYGVKMLKYGIKHAGKHGCLTVKVDTHKINIPMQKCIEKSGFTYRGKINVNTDKLDPSRLAYEIVL